MADFSLEVFVRVWTDSGAAIGISTRLGLGRLRHLETHAQWLQAKVRTGAIQVRKVRGEVNPADLYAKYLPSRIKIAELVKLFGCESATAPLLRPVESADSQGGQPSGGHLPAFHLREAEAHNTELLLHLHSEDDVDSLFPRLRAFPQWRMWRTARGPRIVKCALMVSQAMRPGFLTGARGARMLPRVGGRPV